MRNIFLQMMLRIFENSDFPSPEIMRRLFLVLLLALVPTLVIGETSSGNGASSFDENILPNEDSAQEDVISRDDSISKKETPNVSAAFALYKEKAEQGDVEAQFNVGVMCETGWSVPIDNKKAVRWYREAAKKGHANAQVRLGMLYYLGLGANQSDIKGQKWIREAAKQNHVLAENIYKKILSEDVPNALMPQSAIKKVRNAYLKNEKTALAVLNQIVNEAKQQDALDEKKKEDSTIRERRVQRSAEGPVKPGFSTSVEAERIKSVVPGFIGDASLEEDRTLARGSVATIRLQAEKGMASAEYNLGRMYELGIKLPVDKQLAFEWYTKSAKQAYANAEYRLGIAMLYGTDVNQDVVQGKHWLTLAAKHGHAVAKKMVEGMQNQLGSANISMAAYWYIERALEGDAESSFHLGKLYQYGWGVETDNREAIKWYRRASSLGFQEADVSLKKLELKTLTQNAPALTPEAEADLPILTEIKAAIEELALPAWLVHPGVIAVVVVMLLWAAFFRGGVRRKSRKGAGKKKGEIQEI